ncbi:hypothetical protein SPRG_16519 [Saprolegnia parasitica CBS 223.65]|uniref:Uncharacterized protein n=1 Tax=Saprolegnia parasitica (strain CBS 223.65) TaxID=695850 RepID=A0A067BI81_SAPPC|nr:hypothetical protein SPRG_16519 [Saprolegnia parasitica CBS 223.65]KDO18104.1 hypothetical protein SPRG_16519 [Saprolegnia parasitica CBS 223.65]|eukprot:XP_012211185.1 hypothetical protein SPRG_16519 [Saprolegnia parasitica CBS 223.65]
MDVMLYCSSGHVQIGNFSRLLFLLAWLVVLLLVSTLSVAVVQWRRRRAILCIEESAYTVLPPLAVAHWPRGGIAVDDISGLLCGLLFVSKTHVFDTKLWLWLSPETFEWHRHCLVLLPPAARPMSSIVAGATPIKPAPPRHRFQCKLSSLSLLFGCLYIVATLGSNVAYLNLVRDNLANDFFWAGFNATGSYAFVANAINQRLLTNASTELILDATTLIDYSQPYDEAVATIAWPVTAASRALQDRGVLTLATAVRGLRTMDPCRLPWVSTQYCWLDVNQRWGMAHTQGRQDRCQRHMASNAAVYLETALRNLNDWGRWHSCYGDSFTIGIANELQRSSAGQGFLTSLQSTPLLSVEDEVAYWREAHLVFYELQWQNFKTTGFQDAMRVENALGLSYALPIANVVSRFHPTRQTSHVMNWALASDFWAVGASNASRIAGRSLLRSSSDFAFANVSSEQLLVDNLTLSYPLSSGFHSLSSHLGPFNAVDMVIVPVPPPLLRYYAMFRDALARLSAANLEAQARYVGLPTKYFVLSVPMVWQALPNGISTGGNLLCGDNAVSGFLSFGMGIGFGATSYCNSVYLEAMQPTAPQVLFALAAFNATSTPSMGANDYVDICRSDAILDSRCVNDYTAGGRFLETFYSSLALTAEAQAAYDSVAVLNVTVVQYGRQSDGSSSLLQLSLLGSVDRIWSFYGWMLLYEWTSGRREVVAFTGDAGVVTTMSLGVVPVTMPPDANSIPQAYAFYCQQIVLYITIVLISMAIIVLGYTLHMRGHIEGLNLFEFNRTVGIVWVGRSVLFVRSLTALCLLHTSTLTLSRRGLGTLLVSPPLHWTKIVLAASEATWLVYVLNDILSCVTQQYTPSYAYKSSLLTWSCTFFWTLLDAPPSATANVARVCELVNMDDGLVCVSGRVQIGRVDRVCTTVGIALGCILATYGIERMLQPALRRRDAPSLLLNAQSVYCLLFRKVNGACYLDKASAALAGLLTFSQGDVWYVLDVKTWRLLVVPTRAWTDHDDAAHLRHCLPLSQL